MKVTVKDIEAQLGNNGVILYIADNAGKHVGKLRIGQATVEWCAVWLTTEVCRSVTTENCWSPQAAASASSTRV